MFKVLKQDANVIIENIFTIDHNNYEDSIQTFNQIFKAPAWCVR